MDVSTRGLRRIWFYLHLWIGVGLALATIPLSISGSYLVWRDQIDHATHPARFAVTSPRATLAPSAYLAAAQGAFGDKARVSGLRLPTKAGDPVTVTGAIDRGGRDGAAPRTQAGPQARQQVLTAWIDPGTAKVLDVANVRQGFSMWVHDLHGQFFVFGTGRLVVGWFGVAMLISCVSGIWLWWPRSGSVAKAFRWLRTPDTLLNLHHVVGFWAAVPLALLSLSGALVAFPPFTRAVVGAFAPVTPQQAGRGPGGPGGPPVRRTELTPDQAAAKALDAHAGARLASLTLPTRSGDNPSWRVQLRYAEGKPLNLMVEDAETGGARAVPDRPRLSGDQVVRFNRQLHDGDDTPLLWQVIITLAGLAPGVLGVTGVIVWARRQLRKFALGGRLAMPATEAAPAE